MTLQEMFDKAVAHFAQMQKPSMSTPSEYGGSDCAYRGHAGNKCIVGAFIDDAFYRHTLEGKGVLEYSTINKSCGVQPVLNAVAETFGVDRLSYDQGRLLFKLQLVHDDHSDGFDTGEDNWYEIVKPYLIDLADDYNLAYKEV